jgi:hypothetical protein
MHPVQGLSPCIYVHLHRMPQPDCFALGRGGLHLGGGILGGRFGGDLPLYLMAGLLGGGGLLMLLMLLVLLGGGGLLVVPVCSVGGTCAAAAAAAFGTLPDACTGARPGGSLRPVLLNKGCEGDGASGGGDGLGGRGDGGNGGLGGGETGAKGGKSGMKGCWTSSPLGKGGEGLGLGGGLKGGSLQMKGARSPHGSSDQPQAPW